MIGQLADCLAVPLQDLLSRPTAPAPNDLTRSVGAAMLAHGRTAITGLAEALAATVDDVTTAVAQMKALLTAAGMSIARHQDEVWLVPLVDTQAAAPADRPLTFAEARLLRRIDHGDGPSVTSGVAASLFST